MIRYVVFYGSIYYPSRGLGDWYISSTNKDEAMEAANRKIAEDNWGNYVHVWSIDETGHIEVLLEKDIR